LLEALTISSENGISHYNNSDRSFTMDQNKHLVEIKVNHSYYFPVTLMDN